jgi:hypothetical protein
MSQAWGPFGRASSNSLPNRKIDILNEAHPVPPLGPGLALLVLVKQGIF